MSGRVVVGLKVVVHVLALLPALYLVRMYQDGGLAAQADPVNYITHFTGNWALWILLGDLAITPVRRLWVRLAWLIRFRRLVGLYAFFYATLHLLTYIFLFSGFDVPAAMEGLKAGQLLAPWRQFLLVWPSMLQDVEKRPFIQVGFAAWLILLALAATSPQRVMRAMGGTSWRRVHWLIYVAGGLALAHYWWQVKGGVRTPLPDTLVFSALMLARVLYWGWKRWKQRPGGASVQTV